MSALKWDAVGDRTYQEGLDRGVLYLPDDSVVVWNGLTSVEDTSTSEVTPFYVDGVKFLDRLVPGDFSGKLKAYTYPDEFEPFNGVHSNGPGVFVHNQKSLSFSLSYRTRIGNDVVGDDLGYVIHVLYNVTANPDSNQYQTRNDTPTPNEFGWTLSGRPEFISGFRPTAHISFKSTDMSAGHFQVLEGILYGGEGTDAELPDPTSLMERVMGEIIITDNGDGHWRADGPDASVFLIHPNIFLITDANATYINSDKYEISSTSD